MVEKIAIQIGLDGGKEVERQLAAIGTTGEQAFKQVGQSSEAAATGVAKTGEAADKTSESMSKLSLESVKASAEIAKLTAEIALTGVEIVQAVRHHETLIRSLIKLVLHANTATRVVSALTPELALVGVTFGSTAAAIAAGLVAFEALEKVVTKVASSDEKLNHSLQMLAETSGQSFKSLQEGKDALEQLGIGGDRFEGIVTKINEAISSLDIAAKFREGADAIQNAGALSPEHFKALANNMGAILPLVKQIEEGAKGLKFNELTTAQTKIDAVTASMKQAVDAGKNAGQALLQFIVNADKLSAIQVGKAFGITDEDVDRIRRLAASGLTVEEIFKRIQGAGVLISPDSAAAFDKMRDGIAQADSAWARLKQALASTVFTTLAAEASSAFNSIKAGALNAAAATVEAFNRAGAAMPQVWGNTKRELETVGAVLSALGQMLTDPVAGAKALAQAFATTGEAAKQAGQQAAQGFELVRDPLTGLVAGVRQTNQTLAETGAAAQQAGQQTAQGIQSATTAVSDFVSNLGAITWDTISGAGVAAWNAITSAIGRAIDALLKFIGLKPSAPATGGGAPGNAHGGLLGGRGTGTSDSNLAWVSRGEYITPARAVAQPGVLAFLEALRRGGGNLRGVLDGMGRFALGGLVRGPMPAFASGGLAGGMSHVTIAFPGLPAISGLRASSDVVDQLHRAAALAQVRSGGRKPSRYS